MAPPVVVLEEVVGQFDDAEEEEQDEKSVAGRDEKQDEKVCMDTHCGYMTRSSSTRTYVHRSYEHIVHAC